MTADSGFVIRIWLKSKWGSFAKSLRYSPGSENEIATSYQEGVAAVGANKHPPKLVWEPEISRDDALELCKVIESTPITLVGGELKYIGLHLRGFEFIKGVLKFRAEWETGRPNNDALDEIWSTVDSKLTM